MSTSEIVHQGWLIKSPPSNNKGIFRPRWRKRWFILRTGEFPNQYILEYCTGESGRRRKGQINLDECEQLVGPLSVQERNKFTFKLSTPSRIYYLAANCELEMRKWISSLCQVCSLKVVEEESEGTVYSRAGTSTQQVSVQNQDEVTESDDSSPTLSNTISSGDSGAYIPISECFTGKPILLSENGDVTYCNTSVFHFPPKVNWQTHPVKDPRPTVMPRPDSATTAKVSAVPPPRPPKKRGLGIAVSVTTPELSPVGVEAIKSPTLIAVQVKENGKTYSPLTSGGVVYSNISDVLDNKNRRLSSSSHSSQGSQSISPTSPSPQDVPPPVVDRNLKPLRRTRLDTDAKSPTNNVSPTQKVPTPFYTSGTMTLPSRYHFNSPTSPTEPAIDRSRKPPDGQWSLGPTPAQIKVQSQSNRSFSVPYNQRLTGTLPSSPNRRLGPTPSPNDKRPPVYHQYEQAAEMIGTYLHIECQSNKISPNLPLSNSSSTKKGPSPDPNNSVEYRLIDPVKTQALNKTMEEREMQLRNNTLGRYHLNHN